MMLAARSSHYFPSFEDLFTDMPLPQQEQTMMTGNKNQQEQQEQRNNSNNNNGNNNIPSYGLFKNLKYSKQPFVWKLHIMLQDVEMAGDESIVSWLPQGSAFKVHKPNEFLEKIVPFYFQQSKFKSFQRQLYFYGFTRHHHGRLKGSYSHPKFIRNDRNLCLKMTPQKSSKNKESQSRERLVELSTMISNKESSSSLLTTSSTNSSFSTTTATAAAATTTTTTTGSRALTTQTPPSTFKSPTFTIPINMNARTILQSDSSISNENEDLDPQDGDLLFVFDNMPFHFVKEDPEQNISIAKQA